MEDNGKEKIKPRIIRRGNQAKERVDDPITQGNQFIKRKKQISENIQSKEYNKGQHFSQSKQKISKIQSYQNQNLEIKQSIFGGNNNQKWIIKDKQGKQIRGLEYLKYNSIFSWNNDPINPNYFIHSNYFGEIFNEDNPYGQTQHYFGKISKNQIENQEIKKGQQNPYSYPNHRDTSFEKYLKELFVMYMCTEKSSSLFQNNSQSSNKIVNTNHKVFFYNCNQIDLNVNSGIQKYFGVRKQVINLINEHGPNQDSVVGLLAKFNQKYYFQLYECENRKFIVLQIVKKRDNFIQQYKGTQNKQFQISTLSQNEFIIFFHRLLCLSQPRSIIIQEKPKQGLETIKKENKTLFQNICNTIMKKQKVIEQTLDGLRQWSFTRQFNYQQFNLDESEQSDIQKSGSKRQDNLSIMIPNVTPNLKNMSSISKTQQQTKVQSPNQNNKLLLSDNKQNSQKKSIPHSHLNEEFNETIKRQVKREDNKLSYQYDKSQQNLKQYSHSNQQFDKKNEIYQQKCQPKKQENDAQNSNKRSSQIRQNKNLKKSSNEN